MEMKIFSLRDIKIGRYHMPFLHHSENEAVRAVMLAMMGEKGELCNFPEDFELYQLGTFEEVIGQIKPFDGPKFLISCSSIKNLIQKRKEIQQQKQENIETITK
ncbi:MAG: nonstructural protein [Arizlama microvirus]|nr:MAG: nonstructural protein [Arizlama microvirus]